MLNLFSIERVVWNGKENIFLLNFSILHLDGLQVVSEKHSVYCEILFSVFFSCKSSLLHVNDMII